MLNMSFLFYFKHFKCDSQNIMRECFLSSVNQDNLAAQCDRKFNCFRYQPYTNWDREKIHVQSFLLYCGINILWLNICGIRGWPSPTILHRSSPKTNYKRLVFLLKNRRINEITSPQKIKNPTIHQKLAPTKLNDSTVLVLLHILSLKTHVTS